MFMEIIIFIINNKLIEISDTPSLLLNNYIVANIAILCQELR